MKATETETRQGRRGSDVICQWDWGGVAVGGALRSGLNPIDPGLIHTLTTPRWFPGMTAACLQSSLTAVRPCDNRSGVWWRREKRKKKKKKTGAPYDSFTFAAFPQWCKQQKGRRVEKRMGKRERGRRGVLLLWKNDAAAVLGGCRLGRDREWGERGGRGGEACSIRGEWCGFHGSYPIRRSPPVHRRPQYSKVTNSECPIFPRRLHGFRCALTPLSAREEKRKKRGRKRQLWWAKAERYREKQDRAQMRVG